MPRQRWRTGGRSSVVLALALALFAGLAGVLGLTTTPTAAAAEPEAGDWVYFVTVNPSTGETKFAETYEEHLANVAKLNAWCLESAENKKKCA